MQSRMTAALTPVVPEYQAGYTLVAAVLYNVRIGRPASDPQS